VGGKLIAHGLAAVYAVFLGFPLACLILVAGGYLFTDVLLVAIFALNSLFVAGCIGLRASSGQTERKKAAGRAIWTVMIFWWALPMLAQLLAMKSAPGWLTRGLLLFSLNSTLGSGPRFLSARDAWSNLLCTHLLGWLFFAWSVFALPRQWQDVPREHRFRLREKWRRFSFGNDRVRRRMRERLLEINPFLWLASRDRLRFAGVWVFTGIILGFAAWLVWYTGFKPGPLVSSLIVASVVHRIMMCSAGAGQIMVEQEQGTLEMLLSTPLAAREIMQGQFHSSFRRFVGPAIAVTVVALAAWLAFGESAGRFSGWKLEWVIAACLANYWFDLYAGAWLAMWGAVLARDPRHAAGSALLRLLFLPATIYFGAAAALGFAKVSLGLHLFPSREAALAIWFLVGAGNNMFWLARVRKSLPSRLRTWAFQRYEPEAAGFWGRLGRALGRKWGRTFVRQPPPLPLRQI
jgi:ABC-type transport system involved in multi-copper enzyme maturation permease subunit